MNCCAFANDEVLDFEINQCDSDKTKTIDKDKELKEQVTTPVLNSQVIDRMLLRTSTIQLPSLVTGASAALSAISSISRKRSTHAASTVIKENMNSQIHNQILREETDRKTLKTTAQVETNPTSFDCPANNDDTLKSFQNSAAGQTHNGIITNSLTQDSREMDRYPERSKFNEAIELNAIEANGRKLESKGPLPCTQSPRTMPRCHTSQRRQIHNDIHSASASPNMPSRSVHQNYNHGQVNYSSQNNSPQLGYGPRSSNTSIHSPAGAQSLNSDSPSLIHGQDSNEESTYVAAPTTRKEALQHKVRTIVPKLTNDLRKGQCGRIAVFGGCFLYTGAPYFAAISALKCGADLVHVFCEKEAGNVIKSYSPELIVHPVLDTEYVLEEIDKWLPRLHCVVIGPGLGRNQSMLGRISIIMDKVKASNIPVVIDADGLWHLTNNPNVIKGYRKAVLTPNAVEFSHLVHSVLKRGDVPPAVHPDPKMVAEVSKALGGVTIVHKGSQDVISNGKYTEHCIDDGCPRRCGGQGDLLSGSLAAFLFWAHNHNDCPEPGPGVIAGWAAARLSRACAAQAFSQHGRATTTTDLIAQLESAFSRLYESETCL